MSLIEETITAHVTELLLRYPGSQIRIERDEEDGALSVSLWMYEQDGMGNDSETMHALGEVAHEDLAVGVARLNDGMDGEPA